MTVRMRHTRGHTGNRRSHHALSEPRMARCADCGAMHLRHRMCEKCGKYKGRLVIDMASKTLKKDEKRKSKMKEMGVEEKAPEKASEKKQKKAAKKSE